MLIMMIQYWILIHYWTRISWAIKKPIHSNSMNCIEMVKNAIMYEEWKQQLSSAQNLNISSTKRVHQNYHRSRDRYLSGKNQKKKTEWKHKRSASIAQGDRFHVVCCMTNLLVTSVQVYIFRQTIIFHLSDFFFFNKKRRRSRNE